MTKLLWLLLLLPLSAAAQPTRALGGVTWGMSTDVVLRVLRERGATAQRTSVHAAPSFLRLAGSEALVTSRDQVSRTFYIFRAGKLRKLFAVLDPLLFPEGNFAAFTKQLEQRFGPATRLPGHAGVAWQDRSTRLRSFDHTNSYGFYCLVFEAR